MTTIAKATKCKVSPSFFEAPVITKPTPYYHFVVASAKLAPFSFCAVNTKKQPQTAMVRLVSLSPEEDIDEDSGLKEESNEDSSLEMEFNEDSGLEMEFNEDSSLDMEFDKDSNKMPRKMSFKKKSNTSSGKGKLMEDDDVFHASDDDAKDFDGNDANVHFIARPCNVAAEKADEILKKMLERLKIKDVTTKLETTYLVVLKSKFGELFKPGYKLISTKCKHNDLGCICMNRN